MFDGITVGRPTRSGRMTWRRARRWIAALTAVAIAVPTATSASLPTPAHASPVRQEPVGVAAATDPIVYAHDADGRLAAVVDRTGEAARYQYDRAGNVTRIDRLPATQLAVITVNPPTAGPGGTVTIYGTRFAAGATVSFNGVTATPTAITRNTITVTVPATATTGPISVTSGGSTAAGGTFTVSAGKPPTITFVSPSVVERDGTLTVTGTNFDPVAANNVVTIGGTEAIVTSATPTRLTVAVPPFAAAGNVTVRTPAGSARITGPVITAPPSRVAADVEWWGSLPIGVTSTVPVFTADRIAVAVATVNAGQRVRLEFAGSTFGPCADVKVYAPGHQLVWDANCLSAETESTLAFTPPVTTAYTVVVDPMGTATGQVLVTPRLVGSNPAGPTTVDGPAAALTTTAGQRAVFTFNATGGQRIRGNVSSTYTHCPRVVITAPNGAAVRHDACLIGDFDTTVLPLKGTYRIVVEPEGADAGTVTATLRTAPAAAATAGGPTVTAGPADAAAGSEQEPEDLPVRRAPRVMPGPLAPRPAPPAHPGTSLVGEVRTTAGQPLAGVTLRVDNRSTRTDARGRFRLGDLPSGTRILVIDGRTASRGGQVFGVHRTPVGLRPGVRNELGFVSYLPPLDVAHEVAVEMPLRRAVVLTSPAIPGLEVRLPAGAVVYDADGRPATRLGITAIPVTRSPVPLPKGVHVPVFFTIQPAGGRITGGAARIYYPNYLNLKPGTRVHFWHYDTDPDDLDGWGVYGMGTVDAAGRQVVPDYGVGLTDFDGAMINVPNQPPAPKGPKSCGSPDAGDPVDLGTGLFTYAGDDLELADTLALRLRRGYNAADPTDRAFGIGGNDLYSSFLSSDTDEFMPVKTYDDAELNLPTGGQVRFTRISPPSLVPKDAVLQARNTPGACHNAIVSWNGSGFDVVRRDGLRYVFGDHLPLQRIVDRHGNAVVVERTVFDQDGNGIGPVAAVRSPSGRWLRYTYDSTGRHVVAIDDSAGRRVTYGYDASGHLISATDPAGGVTTYTYDAAGRLATMKDRRGFTHLTNTYDAQGRVTKQVRADGAQWTFGYVSGTGADNTEATVTSPTGRVNRYRFDTDGYLVQVDEAVGTPLARTSTTRRLAGSHLPDRYTDPLGRQTAISYDAEGNVTSVTSAAGTASAATVTWTYNGASFADQPDTMTDPLGNVTRFTYNGTGDLTRVTDPVGQTLTVAYLFDGHPYLFSEQGVPSTSVEWQDGRPVRVIDPATRVTRYSYNRAGGRIRVTGPGGEIEENAFDRFGRLVQTVSPMGNRVQFGRDAEGNLTSITDPLAHATTFAYDSMGRVTARTDALGLTQRATYDLEGHPVTATDRRGLVTSYEYDVLGRVTKIGYGRTGTAPPFVFESTLTYTYDLADRITAAADSTTGGTVGYRYDPLDQLLEETTTDGTVAYTYNAAGLRTGMTVSGEAVVQYGYDPAGRLTTVSQNSLLTTITYDPTGRRSRLMLPNGVTQAYSYDPSSRLTGITWTATAGGTSTSLGDLAYDLDRSGRIAAHRGTSARVSLPAPRTATGFDAMNRLTNLNGASLTYDAEGNLLTAPGATGQWNARGQLTQATVDGATTTLAYDAVGRRRQATAGTKTLRYRYDGEQLVGELDGTLRTRYLRDPVTDTAMARTDSAWITSTYLTDVLGSTVGLARQANATTPATVVTTYTYDPYGAVTSSTANDPNPVRWTGRESGPGLPAGLQSNRARYYSPLLGRFLSDDPLGVTPGSMNLVEYAGGDPVDRIDPSGLSWWDPRTWSNAARAAWLAFEVAISMATGKRPPTEKARDLQEQTDRRVKRPKNRGDNRGPGDPPDDDDDMGGPCPDPTTQDDQSTEPDGENDSGLPKDFWKYVGYGVVIVGVFAIGAAVATSGGAGALAARLLVAGLL